MPLSHGDQEVDSGEWKGVKCACEVTDTVLYMSRKQEILKELHIGQSWLVLILNNNVGA